MQCPQPTFLESVQAVPFSIAAGVTSQSSNPFENFLVSIAAGLLQFVMKHPETVGLMSLLILTCIFGYIVHIVVTAMLTLSSNSRCPEGDRSSKIVTRKTLPHGGEFEKSDRAPRRPPTRR